MKDSPWGKEKRRSKMGYKKSRWSRIVTLFMSFEDVTKDIKDERQPMGKEETLV